MNKIEIYGHATHCGFYMCGGLALDIGILGRKGFFSQFAVIFNQPENYFSIYKRGQR